MSKRRNHRYSHPLRIPTDVMCRVISSSTIIRTKVPCIIHNKYFECKGVFMPIILYAPDNHKDLAVKDKIKLSYN